MDPRTVNLTQRRLLSPTFHFARELVNGKVRGFESTRPLTGSEPQIESIQISDALFKAFKDFVAADPTFNVNAAQIDRYRSFVERELRFHIVTASFGRVIGDRVFIMTDDPQVAKAVDVLPKARDLASMNNH